MKSYLFRPEGDNGPFGAGDYLTQAFRSVDACAEAQAGIQLNNARRALMQYCEIAHWTDLRDEHFQLLGLTEREFYGLYGDYSRSGEETGPWVTEEIAKLVERRLHGPQLVVSNG